VPSHVVILDRTGRIVMANESWRRFVVENGGDLRLLVEGENYLAVCDSVSGSHPEVADARAVASGIRDVQAGRLPVFMHQYTCHAPAGRRWFQVRVTPLPSAGPACVVVMHTDITHSRAVEEARIATQRRFESLFQFAPDALFVSTPDGVIRQVNLEAERLFGYEAGELVGASISAIVPEDLRAAHREFRRSILAAAYPRKLGAAGQRIRLVRKDGSEIFAEVTVGPLETDDGLAVVSAIRDVSERCALEDQLRQAQKLEVVGQLSGGIAHDFNNLVQVIRTSAEFALSQLPEGGAARPEVEVIHTAGMRASSLIRQLLAFGGRQMTRPEALDLSSVAAGLEVLLQRLMGPAVSVEIRCHGHLRPVHADPTQIEQLLLNLAANSRDAMPDGGTLSIELSSVTTSAAGRGRVDAALTGELVQMVVRDTGVGMDADTRARIFEPFFTTKCRGKGTGLGLPTVYGIVRQLGGDIQCDSQPGLGTTFTIHLPGVEGEARPSAARAEPEQDEQCRGTETILVIDDEEFLRMTLVRALERRGYRVLAAGSGDEAVCLVEGHEGPLDLVVSDILMPGMSGVEVVERIRELRDVRALFMSGYPDEQVLGERLDSRAACFIAKPFSGASLARKVREALSAPDEALAAG
jgi:PAS domain S-box-containing protein